MIYWGMRPALVAILGLPPMITDATERPAIESASHCMLRQSPQHKYSQPRTRGPFFSRCTIWYMLHRLDGGPLLYRVEDAHGRLLLLMLFSDSMVVATTPYKSIDWVPLHNLQLDSDQLFYVLTRRYLTPFCWATRDLPLPTRITPSLLELAHSIDEVQAWVGGRSAGITIPGETIHHRWSTSIRSRQWGDDSYISVYYLSTQQKYIHRDILQALPCLVYDASRGAGHTITPPLDPSDANAPHYLKQLYSQFDAS